MKKFLKITDKNIKYVNNLPNIYLVCCWAHWGVMKLSFTGKYKYDKERKRYIPLVYEYDDHNGEYEEYILLPVTYVTTGQILTWTDNEGVAQLIADAMEFSKEKHHEEFEFFRENRYK